MAIMNSLRISLNFSAIVWACNHLDYRRQYPKLSGVILFINHLQILNHLIQFAGI
jgi:hypothetical protein